jgi:hypothetical protein
MIGVGALALEGGKQLERLDRLSLALGDGAEAVEAQVERLGDPADFAGVAEGAGGFLLPGGFGGQQAALVPGRGDQGAEEEGGQREVEGEQGAPEPLFGPVTAAGGRQQGGRGAGQSQREQQRAPAGGEVGSGLLAEGSARPGLEAAHASSSRRRDQVRHQRARPRDERGPGARGPAQIGMILAPFEDRLLQFCLPGLRRRGPGGFRAEGGEIEGEGRGKHRLALDEDGHRGVPGGRPRRGRHRRRCRRRSGRRP